MSSVTDLNFDIYAKYREASKAFQDLAGDVDKLQRKLKELDKAKANPEVDLGIKKAKADLAGFKADLTKLRNVKLKIEAEMAKTNVDINRLQAKLTDLRNKPTTFDVRADIAKAERDLRQLNSERDRLKDIRFRVTADIAETRSQIADVDSDLGRLERDRSTTLSIGADTAGADRDVDAFATGMRARLTAAINSLPPVRIGADTSDADAQVNVFSTRTRARLTELINSMPDIRLDADADFAGIEAKIAVLEAQLASIGNVTVRGNADFGAVEAQILALSAELRLLSGQNVNIEAKFNASRALTEMSLLRRTMGDTGQDGNSLLRTLGAVGSGFTLLTRGVGSAVSSLGSLIGEGTKAGSAMTSLGASIGGSGGGISGSFANLGGSAAAAAAQLAISGVAIVGIGSLIAGAGAVAVAAIGQLGGAVIALASGIVPLTGLLGLLPGLIAPVGVAVGALAIAFGDAGLKKELENTGKAFEPLVNNIRNQLRPALTGMLNAVETLIPHFQRMAPVITSAISEVTNRFSQMFRSSSFHADLEAILRGAGQTIRDFGAASESVFGAFVDIMISAQPVVNALTNDIKVMAADFAAWIAEARRSGELTTLFSEALSVFRQLVGVVGNLAGLFKDLWDSANRTGAFRATLDALNTGITRFRDYVSEVGGAWDQLMAKAGPVTTSVIGFIDSIGRAFVNMGAHVDVIPLFDRISAAITNLTPTFERIAQVAVPAFEKIVTAGEKLMIAIGPDIERTITGVVDALAAMAPSLETIIPALGRLAVGAARMAAAVGIAIDHLITFADIGERLVLGDFSGAWAQWEGLQERTHAAAEALHGIVPAADAATGAVAGVGAAINDLPPSKSVLLDLDTSSMNADTQAAIAYINRVPENWFTRFAGDMINLGAVAVMAQTETGAVPTQHNTSFTGDVSQLSPAAAEAVGHINRAPKTWLTMFAGNVIDIVSRAGEATGAVNGVPSGHPTAFTGDPTQLVGTTGIATGAINGVPPDHNTDINAKDNSTSTIQNIIGWLNRIPQNVVSTITTVYRTITGGAAGFIATPAGIAPMAGGGVLPMARGDNLSPMSGSTARIVPPNTPRVIGDRIRDDEAFIPINDSVRSTAILSETARRKGFALMPMARGGTVITEDDPRWPGAAPWATEEYTHFSTDPPPGTIGNTAYVNSARYRALGGPTRSTIGFSLTAMSHGGINSADGMELYWIRKAAFERHRREWARSHPGQEDTNTTVRQFWPEYADAVAAGFRGTVKQFYSQYRRPGSGGGIPGRPGGVGGPAGPAPVGRVMASTLTSRFQTAGGMASITRANPMYSPMPYSRPSAWRDNRSGGPLRIEFGRTGSRVLDEFLQEIAAKIRAAGGNPQQFFGYR